MTMSMIKDKVLSFFKAHWGKWLWGLVVLLLGAKTGLLWGDFITTTIGLGPDDYNGLAGGIAYLLAAGGGIAGLIAVAKFMEFKREHEKLLREHDELGAKYWECMQQRDSLSGSNGKVV